MKRASRLGALETAPARPARRELDSAMQRERQAALRYRPVRKRAGYLPALDGWRAVAILGVILTHDSLHAIGPFSTLWVFQNGKNGVDLFFAISGLLICWRLLEEEQFFGRISLRNFYIRRAFRILPPALAFLVAVAILGLTGVLHIGVREWLVSLFFLRNYTSLVGQQAPDSYFTSHFWSLAVEEHFYLILPALLVLTRKRWRLGVLIGLSVVVAAHRFQVLESRPWEHVLFHTDIRLDALLIPAILAVLAQSSKVREKLAAGLRIWPLLSIALLFLVSHWEGAWLQITLVALLMPLMVLGSVLNPRGYLTMALEWAPLRYLGRISYSLYLWQELFFTGHYYHGFPLGILERTPLRYIALLAIAVASYHFLERPLIELGHRLAPPATPGRDDIPDELPGIQAAP
jgi:peptidoglycan/LPS O-acetylase OafA/YrhL